jgi:hypothetical protein
LAWTLASLAEQGRERKRKERANEIEMINRLFYFADDFGFAINLIQLLKLILIWSISKTTSKYLS